MYKENIKKLKKYLLFISILFVVLIGAHLFYIYLNEEAKDTPIEGGVISEGIVGKISNFKFNPLMYGKNLEEDYIISFLYRSLLTYNPEKQKIDSDLAICDYSNLLEIKCILKDDLKWSDGTEIKAEDVLATYKIIKDKKEKINLGEYAYLKNTDISLDSEKNIIFKYNKTDGDINFITKVLFQPIISKTDLDGLGTGQLFGKFNLENLKFSGEYIYSGLVEEENGITKLKTIKNPYYNGKKSYIAKYNFKFSENLKLLIQNINIFNNKTGLISKKGRFNEYKYNSSNFLSLFINVDKIENVDLRKFIFSNIKRENILNLINKDGELKNIIPVENPFFLKGFNLESNVNNFDLAGFLKKKGYKKKSEILEEYLLKNKKIETKNTSNTLEEKIKNIDNLNKKLSDNKKLKYIISQEINSKYSFISDEVIINGKTAGEKVDNVIIKHNDRDIILNSFKKSGKKSFVFGLKSDFNTLNEGKNIYKLYFNNTKDKNNLKEEFIVFYSKDKEKLKKMREEFYNSPEVKKEKKQEEDKEKSVLKSIELLEDNFFYNDKLEAFTFKMYYIEGENSDDNFTVTKNIISQLEQLGIKVEASPIKLRDLKKRIDAGKKDYDLILAQIDLGYFKYNIARYFHSYYAKKGFNLSNLRAPELDGELLELNKQFLLPEKRLKKQRKILKILKEKQVVKTLYSVINTKFVDKTIKNYKNYEKVPNYIYTSFGLKDSYIKAEKQIDFSKKSFSGYLTFLKQILFGEYKENTTQIIKK